jgi:hypothetical protein
VVGINLDQMAHQLALLAIAQNKRYKAELHVAAGRFKLGMEELAAKVMSKFVHMREWKMNR